MPPPHTAGDLDADGRPDLLVGALLEDSVSDPSGTVYALSGATLPPGDSVIGTVGGAVHGDSDPTGLGFDVAGGVDVDGDGIPDAMLVATFNGSNGISSSYFVADPDPTAGATSSVADAAARFTCATSSWTMRAAISPDADADGAPDIVVGCGGEASIYLFHDTPAGDLGAGDADVTLTHTGPTYFLGNAVASLGDLDGDGLDDILAGGRYLDSAWGPAISTATARTTSCWVSWTPARTGKGRRTWCTAGGREGGARAQLAARGDRCAVARRGGGAPGAEAVGPDVA